MKALEYLLARPLLVTPEVAKAALRVASRETSPMDAVEARRGMAAPGSEAQMTLRGNVAVIPITGPIMRHADLFTHLCGGVSTETLAIDITRAIENPQIESIVMRIDSPGGEATGIAELAGMIRAGTSRKPIVAYVEGYGASAAYWLASAASEIVMNQTAMVGSIGAVMGWTEESDAPGTKSYEFVSSVSPNKRPDVETPAGKAQIQSLVDQLGEVFVATVADYRGVSTDTVLKDFGGGGMKFGQSAVDAGMADRVGTFEGLVSDLVAGAAPGRGGVFRAAADGDAAMALFGWTLKPKADGTIDMTPKSEADIENEKADAAASAKLAAGTAQLNAELEAANASLAEYKAEAIKARALGWYYELFSTNKVVPAEKDEALELYVRAALDDVNSPLGNGETRVAKVEAAYAKRTKHTLDKPLETGKALPIDGHTDPESPEAVERVLQHLVNAGRAPASVLSGK